MSEDPTSGLYRMAGLSADPDRHPAEMMTLAGVVDLALNGQEAVAANARRWGFVTVVWPFAHADASAGRRVLFVTNSNVAQRERMVGMLRELADQIERGGEVPAVGMPPQERRDGDD